MKYKEYNDFLLKSYNTPPEPLQWLLSKFDLKTVSSISFLKWIFPQLYLSLLLLSLKVESVIITFDYFFIIHK